MRFVIHETPNAFANCSPGLERERQPWEYGNRMLSTLQGSKYILIRLPRVLATLFIIMTSFTVCFPDPVVSGLSHSPQALAWGPRCLLLLKTI